MVVTTITTPVDEMVSCLEGQVTFFSSTFTSLRNVLTLFHMAFPCNLCRQSKPSPTAWKRSWQARRDSNPHHPVLETGALTVRATGLSLLATETGLLRLLVDPVALAKTAIFFQLDTLGRIPLVLRCRIVAPFASGALKCNDYAHSDRSLSVS